MYCPRCSNDDVAILQEKKPIGAGAIIGAILLFFNTSLKIFTHNCHNYP